MKIIAFTLAAAVLPAPCLAQLQATTRGADRLKNDRVLHGGERGDGRFLEVEDSMSIGMMEDGYMGKSSKDMDKGKGRGKSGKGEKMEYGCSIDAMVGSFAGQAYLYAAPGGGYFGTQEVVVTFARPEVSDIGDNRRLAKGDKGGPAMPTGPAGVMTSKVCITEGALGDFVAIQTGAEKDGVIPFTLNPVIEPGWEILDAWTANGEYYCDSNEMHMGLASMFTPVALPLVAPLVNDHNMIVDEDGCPVGMMGSKGMKGSKSDKMGSKGMKGGKSAKKGSSKGMKGGKSGKAGDHGDHNNKTPMPTPKTPTPPTPTPPTPTPPTPTPPGPTPPGGDHGPPGSTDKPTYFPSYYPTYFPTEP